MNVSYLYVISESPDMHKVGFAKDPQKRLSQLQTARSTSLYIAHTRECDEAIVECAEKLAHQSLSEFRANREWFNTSLDVAISSVDMAVKLAAKDAVTPGPINPYIPIAPDDLKAWRNNHQISQVKAAALMGFGLSRWRNLELGVTPIPRALEFACRYIDEHPEVLSAPPVNVNAKNNDGTLLGMRPIKRFASGSPSDNAILINRALNEPDVERVIFFSSIRDIKEVGIGHKVGALVLTSRTAHLFDESECHVTSTSPHREAEVREFVQNAISGHPHKIYYIPDKLLSFQLPKQERDAVTYLLKAETEPLTSYEQFHKVVRYLDSGVY